MPRSARARALALSLSLSLLGVGCDPQGPNGDAGPRLDGADLDGGDFDGGTDAGPRPPDVCDTDGIARSPMATSTGFQFWDIAGDFTANTLDGPYHYATERSGCESYVFLNYFPELRASPRDPWLGDIIWNNSAPDPFFSEGPRNVQYFFTSYEVDAGARQARMEAMRALLEESLLFQFPADEAQRDFWRSRFHFVTDRLNEIEGSIGQHVTDYMAFVFSAESAVVVDPMRTFGTPVPFFFGIDRHQRFHAGDDLTPFVTGSPFLGMAAYAGHYYNHLFEVDAHVAADGATVVPILDDERTTTRVFNREVTLPSPAAMAAFDHLEVEIAITCDARNPFACSEWDRIADVQLCLDAECTDRREIARWITPYWRRGPQHWTIDATPLLPLLAAGGTTRFFVETGPEWERATEYVGTVALRFSTVGGSEPAPLGATRVFTGGAFDASYNTREPIAVAIPTGVSRVELVTILSGHGQVDGTNCAEWCDHRHVFSVNGTALPAIAYDGAIGSGLGCAHRAADGVPPNQLGNWAPERAYWCPGLPVDAQRTDITALVTPGRSASIDYDGFLRTAVPTGGDIALSAYVVWYE